MPAMARVIRRFEDVGAVVLLLNAAAASTVKIPRGIYRKIVQVVELLVLDEKVVERPSGTVLLQREDSALEIRVADPV
jgi:hypothetical protein